MYLPQIYFRSPGTGLYDNLKQYRIPYPEAVFDMDYFDRNPRPFFSLAKDLYPSCKYQPNLIHYFLRILNEKGNLLRVYTQNIDGLEKSEYPFVLIVSVCFACIRLIELIFYLNLCDVQN